MFDPGRLAQPPDPLCERHHAELSCGLRHESITKRRPGERRDPYAASSHFRNGCSPAFAPLDQRWLWVPAFAGTTKWKAAALEHQRLRLLHLRQRLHLAEHVRRHRAVDLDQRDGVAARLVAAEMEGRDVDLGIAEQACEVADESRLVLLIGLDHRLAEL